MKERRGGPLISHIILQKFVEIQLLVSKLQQLKSILRKFTASQAIQIRC